MSLDIPPGVSEPNEMKRAFQNFFDAFDEIEKEENKSLVSDYCRNCKDVTKQHTMPVQQAIRSKHPMNIQIKKLFCTSCGTIQYYYSDEINLVI